MRYILYIFLILSFTNFCFGQEKELLYIETMPRYPGGEAELYNFIRNKRTYPKSAQEEGIEGRVITRFVVLPDGSIDNVTIVRGIHPACDSVAINIIRSMPKWIPGTLNEKAVPISYILHIIFPYDMKKGEKVYWAPDQKASFLGADQALFKFITENLKYPVQEPCCQGKVIIRFIVTKEGKIESPEIVTSLDTPFDKESLRVINLMPDWIPARHKGEVVNSYFILPIVFRLKE